MSHDEWIARCKGLRCAHCRQHILKVDSAWGSLYVNSNYSGQCKGPKGLHFP
jgi:hypothetical protein